MEERRAGRWEMKYLRRKGVRSLVMVHGLGMSSEFFRGVFDCPAFNQWDLLAPDLVGFGATSAHREFSYSMTAQAAAVWSLCDLLGMDDISLLGHSMGGTIAVCMAKQRPDRVHKLIVAEGNLVSEPNVLSAKLSAAGEAGAASLWEEIMDRLPIPSLRQTTIPVVVRSAQSLQDTPDRENFPAFLKSSRIPTFFIRGDAPVSETNSLALCSQLGIPVYTVRTSGHFFTSDNPKAFYRLIADILA